MTILENIDSDEDILEYFDIVQGISVNIEIFLFPRQVLVAKNRATLREFHKSHPIQVLALKNWATLLGVSLICGFGVTVSFFSKKAQNISAEKQVLFRE